MAFNNDSLVSAAEPLIPRFFTYTTSDSRATVTGAGYFGRAVFNDITVGSRITVTNGGDTYDVLVTGIDASGGATAAIAEKYNSGAIAIAAGGTINLDSGTATLSSNAATVTTWATLITTEALTTAAGASQAFTITLTGVAAGDFAFVQGTGGGTNTRQNHRYSAVCTSNTVTVTVYNTEPTNALNGTLKFNLLVLKQ